MNYKCSFPAEWLGLENEELEQVTGLQSAGFCHKGGFLMTVGMLEDAVKACRISMELYHENPTIVNLGGDSCIDPLLKQLPGMQEATVIHMDFMQLPELTVDGIYGEAAMDKQQWKNEVKENLKRILKQKPEAVYVEGNVFETYPIVHQLRKKHIPVLTMMEKVIYLTTYLCYILTDRTSMERQGQWQPIPDVFSSGCAYTKLHGGEHYEIT